MAKKANPFKRLASNLNYKLSDKNNAIRWFIGLCGLLIIAVGLSVILRQDWMSNERRDILTAFSRLDQRSNNSVKFSFNSPDQQTTGSGQFTVTTTSLDFSLRVEYLEDIYLLDLLLLPEGSFMRFTNLPELVAIIFDVDKEQLDDTWQQLDDQWLFVSDSDSTDPFDGSNFFTNLAQDSLKKSKPKRLVDDSTWQKYTWRPSQPVITNWLGSIFAQQLELSELFNFGQLLDQDSDLDDNDQQLTVLINDGYPTSLEYTTNNTLLSAEIIPLQDATIITAPQTEHQFEQLMLGLFNLVIETIDFSDFLVD